MAVAVVGAGLSVVPASAHGDNTNADYHHICMKVESGAARVLKQITDTCLPSEEALHIPKTTAIGPVGPQGPVGPVGPQGPVGPVGPQGLKGDTGAPGATGATGAAGPVGPKGDTGPQGLTGDTGAIGAQGATGPVGPKGDKGDEGPQGAKGDTGATGAPGPTGPAGAVGAVGPQGLKGDTGAPGAPGATGPAGAVGPAGAKGDTGPSGPLGPIGPQGPAGPAGPKGDKGDKGDTGPVGPAGTSTPTWEPIVLDGFACPEGSTSAAGCPVILGASVLTPLSGAGRAKLAGELSQAGFTVRGRAQDDCRVEGSCRLVHYGVYLLVNGTIRGNCTVEGEVDAHRHQGCAIPGPFTLQAGDLVQVRIDRLEGNQPAGSMVWSADFGPPTPPVADPWD